jgi:hypothetical protein
MRDILRWHNPHNAGRCAVHISTDKQDQQIVVNAFLAIGEITARSMAVVPRNRGLLADIRWGTTEGLGQSVNYDICSYRNGSSRN